MGVQSYVWAWSHMDGLSDCQRLLLLAVADHGGPVCWPGYTKLEAMTGLSRSTCRRGMQALISKGVLAIAQKGSGRRSTRYRLVGYDESQSSQRDHTTEEGPARRVVSVNTLGGQPDHSTDSSDSRSVVTVNPQGGQREPPGCSSEARRVVSVTTKLGTVRELPKELPARDSIDQQALEAEREDLFGAKPDTKAKPAVPRVGPLDLLNLIRPHCFWGKTADAKADAQAIAESILSLYSLEACQAKAKALSVAERGRVPLWRLESAMAETDAPVVSADSRRAADQAALAELDAPLPWERTHAAGDPETRTHASHSN